MISYNWKLHSATVSRTAGNNPAEVAVTHQDGKTVITVKGNKDFGRTYEVVLAEWRLMNGS